MATLLTFGETMLRLSPPDGERIETAQELDFRSAGAESNVAIAATRLGIDTRWLSKLPDSPLGWRAIRDLAANGVDTEIAWSDVGRMGTYYIEQGGEPRGTSVVYDRSDAAVRTATTADFPTNELFADAEAFYTSGITPALSEQLRETTADLLACAQAEGVTTYFDMNYRSKLWSPTEAKASIEVLLPSVDVLVVAHRDAEAVLDCHGTAADVARTLRESHGHKTAVVTRGDDGAVAATAEGVVEQPAFKTDTLDPVGTGDAFVGGYIASRLGEGSVADALETAAATAALKRTLAGDLAVVTPAEVERVCANRGDGIDR
ncbi:sugar kinase [Haloferax sp. AS1]|uniref:bifunctional 2-dehydro-3-deoxygluconokinase/2-dehydro-3- deoxygalactonokinase n=1 Tax=Haloferax sp. AS1 TaxID=2562277 RepID=UPI00165EF722|nr:bifunctional 2-dehydro-3-deoxygluconokinase/2-dehydro-3-deoxygalactonokinase [Haloferax sp. AS1]MBC9987972.1 sugar kinase [Haloferax sp. AS1]